MAERQTPDPRRSAERRPASTRSSGERRQPPRDSSERRQAYGGGERRQAPRDSGERRQTPSRRNDVIRCENCGEDYSITYKRCPFCDERPGRGGVSGKRVANTRGGGYGRPASALRITTWVISFAVILCAAAIVIRFMGAPIFGSKKPNSDSSSDSSQNSGVSGTSSSQQPGSPNGSSSGDPSVPQPSGVEAVVLDTLDFTLDSGATRQLTASLLPAGVEGAVTWTSSDPNAATVNETGLVTNVNAGSAQATATITASCGEFSAQCTVSCKPKPAGGNSASVNGRQGTIVGADTGLNIRSGPGREHGVVASAQNGSTVTILGEENGWYQVRYSGSNTGYVSKEFVSVG